jgi:hypothetical protein
LLRKIPRERGKLSNTHKDSSGSISPPEQAEERFESCIWMTVKELMTTALSEKVIGGFIGAKAIGFSFYESLIFGVGIMPRAGVELVILITGRELRFLTGKYFQ